MSARVRTSAFLAAAVVVAVLMAGVISTVASGEPDGLEKVAAEEGFEDRAREHHLAGSPVADYEVDGVGSARLSVGLAGVAGVAITLAAGGGLFALLRRARRAPAP